MYKTLCISIFTFFTVIGYGQKSTLLQNINFRAKELKHTLSKGGDSLLLQSDKTIYSVEIFNQDFGKTVTVEGNKVKIPLRGTPLGRLVVQAKLVDKRILMTLLRHEPYDKFTENQAPKEEEIVIEQRQIKPEINIFIIPKKESLFTIKKHNELKATVKIINLAKTEKIQDKLPQSNSVASLLNSRLKKTIDKSQKFYWTIQEVNNGNSIYKTMKLVNEDLAKKMIAKNKLEIKTTQGKLNKLVVWEVYDTSKFMELQISNPEYINSPSSEFFKTVPYFFTDKKSVHR